MHCGDHGGDRLRQVLRLANFPPEATQVAIDACQNCELGMTCR